MVHKPAKPPKLNQSKTSVYAIHAHFSSKILFIIWAVGINIPELTRNRENSSIRFYDFSTEFTVQRAIDG